MRYQINRLLARTENYEPTKTDQSQRDGTDINVIVDMAMKTGQMPGPTTEPIYADFAALPDGLREFLDLNREQEQIRRELPEALKGMSTSEIANSDPRDLQKRINNYATAKERRSKLPAHLQSLPDSSVLALTEAQMEHILRPAQPVPPPEPGK